MRRITNKLNIMPEEFLDFIDVQMPVNPSGFMLSFFSAC